MLYAKKRRIAELEALADYLRDELDDARDTSESHADRVERFAGDRIKGARADAREMARLNDIAQGWETLAAQHKRRSARLTRAVVRGWEEIGRLRRQLAALDVTTLTRQLREARERIARLDEQLAILQTANEKHYEELLDRLARGQRQPLAAAS